MTENQKLQCVNCERTAEEVPLIPLVHRNGKTYICPQCMPVLIHQPQKLVGKLAGAETLEPAAH